MRYIRCFLLVCYRNFVPKMRHFFQIFDFKKCRDFESRVRGHSRSSEPSTDTDRSTIYYFLLMFHRNHGPISYHFWGKWRFQSKIAKFSHPVYFAPPAEAFSVRSQKIRMAGLPGRQISLTVSSAVWIQHTNMTDRRMDTEQQQKPRLRIASRSKKQ